MIAKCRGTPNTKGFNIAIVAKVIADSRRDGGISLLKNVAFIETVEILLSFGNC
jgi:hypothetical protein